MTYKEFKVSLSEVLCERFSINHVQKIAGFEKDGKISIANTVEVLLIFELFFGRDFVYKQKQISKEFHLDGLDFDCIENFLNRKRGELIGAGEYRNSDLAYCGIGLRLLNKQADLQDIHQKFEQTKLQDSFCWGVHDTSTKPDILATYYVTMFLNRLHQEVTPPDFIKEKYQSLNCLLTKNKLKKDDYTYLVLILYMFRYYYGKDELSSGVIKSVNDYYRRSTGNIVNCRLSEFTRDKGTNYHIFAFGLAAYLVEENPFFIQAGNSLLSEMNPGYVQRDKSIPYYLELSRLYTAVKRHYDPFKNSYTSERMTQMQQAIEQMAANGNNCLTTQEVKQAVRQVLKAAAIALITRFIYIFLFVGLVILFVGAVIYTVQEPTVAKVAATVIVAVVPICIGGFKPARKGVLKFSKRRARKMIRKIISSGEEEPVNDNKTP